MKMKPVTLGHVVSLMILLVVGTLLTSCVPDPETILRGVVDEFNTTTPIDIDSHTRLDSAELLENRSIRMNYTLTQDSKSDIDLTQIATIESVIQPQVLDQIRSSESLEVFKNYGVTFQYAFHSNDGEELFVITITPADYA